MFKGLPDRKARRAAGGFTLLEILVAVAILGMAYLVVLESFSLSLRNIKRVEDSGRRNYLRLLEREKELMVIPGRLEIEPPVGESYLEGNKFLLVLVDGAGTSGLAILLLERQQ